MEEKIINNNLIDTKEECNYSRELIVEAMKKVKDPFKMLTIEDVMKDLNICYSNAHAFFKCEDFPCMKIGKQDRGAVLAYALWKMKNIQRVVK